LFDRFFSTLSLVSRIPVKFKFVFDASRIDFYLPLTGVCPALINLLLFIFLSLVWDNPVLTAVVILITQYLCFNLFHLDGLMDTADAFLGTVDREKRQAILKDSRIGVYGFFAGFSALALKIALLSGLSPFIFRYPAALLAYPVCGRFAASLIPCMTNPANPGGLGALGKNAKPFRAVLGALMGLLIWTLLAWGLTNAAALWFPVFDTVIPDAAFFPALLILAIAFLLISPLTALFYARLYGKSLGGYSGDALGAAIETGELLYLLAAYVVFGQIWLHLLGSKA
jgi:adenosylcobinamide-GDP ribazoletransferase